MPKDKQPQKQETKVIDKRIFTPEGEIREEFREQITPSEAPAAAAEPAARPAEPPAPEPPQQRAGERRQSRDPEPPGGRERRSVAEKAVSPETPFCNFIEPLIAQAYMSLGMLQNPYQPQSKIDPNAARQMIDILVLLRDKTAGNLTPDEEDFLETHLAELKLAYVQRTKKI
ncbi:MAG TPA: DUF1844 domain-containing protein [Thermoanaerobaculia bacterium]